MSSYDKLIIKYLTNDSLDIYTLNPIKVTESLLNLLDYQITTTPNCEIEEYLFNIFDILNNITPINLLKVKQNVLINIYNKLCTAMYTTNNQKNLMFINKYKNFINEHYEIEKAKNFNELFLQIILNQKFISETKRIVETYPTKVNIFYKEKPLIYLLVDKFIESIKQEHLDNILYYEDTIDLLIKSNNIPTSTINDITTYLRAQDYNFYINDLLNTILGQYNYSENYINEKFQINSEFNKDLIKCSNNIYINYSNLPDTSFKRKIYTFDGEGAKELDDGISLTKEDGIYHLGVHIADPTAYITYESLLMNEAKKRTTTVYFNTECIPMYPIQLSGDLMSLNENKNTYSMSYYFDIDELTGELLNFEVKNEIIRIEKNLTYNYLDNALIKGTDNEDFDLTMTELNKLSKILKQSYNEENLNFEFNNSERTNATEIVASTMIYTNQQIAKKFDLEELPFIYRCHEINTNTIEFIAYLEKKLKSEYSHNVQKELNRFKNNLPRAYYSSNNHGHYALGIDYYSHATSPLRRLSDNLVNLCIKQFILGNYTKEDIKIYTEEINKTCDNINSKRVSRDIYSILKEKGKIKK